MFVQVISGRVTDREGVERQADRWERELRPGAEGFLGSTSGITDDGRLVAVVRFESEEAARRNSDRPEQSAWWAETEKMLEQVTFQDSVNVTLVHQGGSNDAGFVQLMRGRVLDASKFEQLRSRMAEFESAMAAHRPDVIGGVTVVHGDGSYTDVVYFTSEAEARENERKPLPPEMQATFEEWTSAAAIDEYIDLRKPRLL